MVSLLHRATINNKAALAWLRGELTQKLYCYRNPRRVASYIKRNFIRLTRQTAILISGDTSRYNNRQ